MEPTITQDEVNLSSVFVSEPGTEPLTLTQIKQQLGMPEASTHYDDKFAALGKTARMQWEHDTQSLATTAREVLERRTWFPTPNYRFYYRPVEVVNQITYYDPDNVQQTLANTVYSVDYAGRRIYLNAGESWPEVAARWDAVTIDYNAGAVSDISQQAMLILCDVYWEERGLGTRPKDAAYKTYELLAARFARSSYP